MTNIITDDIANECNVKEYRRKNTFQSKCNENRYQSQNIIYPNSTYELPYTLWLDETSIKLNNTISGDILDDDKFCVLGNPVKDELYIKTCRQVFLRHHSFEMKKTLNNS